MKFADIRSALIQSWLDGDFGLDTAYPNKKFDPTAGTPWAAVFILPNQPEVATLGKNGEDVHDGVFQISLFYPPDQGDADIMAKADAVAAHYKAGNRYTYDGQGVLIRSCGRSQGRLDDGWYRIDLTVNWQSHVSRAAPAPSCAYPLNDDGTVASSFGYAHAPANEPDYKRVDYTYGTSAATGNGAITPPDDPFGADLISIGDNIIIVGCKNISLGGDPADYESSTLINSVQFAWNNGADNLALWAVADASGNLFTETRSNGVTKEGPADRSVPWEGSRMYLYINAISGDPDEGRVGFNINGVDYGYVSGITVNTSSVAAYLFIDDEEFAHPDRDGLTVSYQLLTRPEADDQDAMSGFIDLCRQTIP